MTGGRSPVTLLLVALLAACSGDAPDASPAGNEDSARAAVPAPDNALIGSSQGLGRASATVKFGAPLADAIALAEAAGGRSEPPQQLEECGAGPLSGTRIGNLLLLGQDGRFVGWHISESGPVRLQTDRGLTIGSTKGELASVPRIQLFESSLGSEFHSVDGSGGLLDGASPAAKIAHLWAGTTCMMR